MWVAFANANAIFYLIRSHILRHLICVCLPITFLRVFSPNWVSKSPFGSIVYNRAKVYIYQNFLKVIVHVMIIDQWNQTTCLYAVQGTVIYSHTILVAVMSECRAKRLIRKSWTGTLANSADPHQTPQKVASDQGLYCLLKFGKLRVNWNS